MSRTFAKEFLEWNWLKVHDRYLQFIVSDIFMFYSNQWPEYFNEVFCPFDDNGLATRSCNKKLKLPFRMSKLEMKSLSYVGPSTCNKLPNNLKTATSVTALSTTLKNTSKLSETEAALFIVTLKEKTLGLERNQDKYTFCFYFFSIQILKFLSMISNVSSLYFSFHFRYIFFLWDHNGNKAVQLLCAIPVAIDFLIAFRNSAKIL